MRKKGSGSGRALCSALGLLAGLSGSATGAEALRAVDGARWVEVSLTGTMVEARATQPCERLSLTVKGPGSYWRRAVQGCDAPTLLALDEESGAEQTGDYVWEARLLGPGPQRVAWGRFTLPNDSSAASETGSTARVPTADLTISDPTPQLIFDDTDAGSDDWEVRTSANGAQFLVQDVTAGTSPVVVESLAPSNSLYLSKFLPGTPMIGVGTATPGNPGFTLAGNAGLTFDDGTTAWKVFGNTNAFGIGEAPRINLSLRPGAPGRSIHMDSTGNVALFADSGLANVDVAQASLHVKRTNGNAKLKVEEASATTQSRNLLQIVNNGASTFRFDNTFDGSAWGFGSRGTGDFFIGKTPGQTFAFNLTSAGNLTITGTLTQGSDRNSKEDIDQVDPVAVLARVAELPIATWRYRGDAATHAGPMAQDFHAAFGLGEDDRHIAPGDMAGLSLAAIQALVRQNEDLRAELERLGERVGALEGSPSPR